MSYQLSGFHLAYNEKGLETIINHYRLFKKIIPTWVEVKSDGSIQVNNSNETIEKYMGKRGIVPMVQNANMDSKVSNLLISKQNAINCFIKEILIFLENEGYKEVCIDIEGVKYKNKIQYTEFIKKVADAFQQEGYSLSVVIPAKSENNQDSTWSGAYDYSSLGKIANKVIIMAYDFHWPGGPPGPIAPLSWVQDVIDYAIIEIPLEKLYLGLGLYGYDWVINSEQKTRGLVFKQIQDISLKYNVKVEWDQESQSPYLRYKENSIEHEVWFENKESISKKIRLIEEFQLKGVVFWRVGQEDPDVWKLFE